MAQPAVTTTNLGKRYGRVVSVDGLDLRVGRGEIYGFIGLNGAGKTTTIRALLGMIRPTTGSAHLLGVPVARSDATLWRRVGYTVEAPAAYPELTVLENLEIARRLQRFEDAKAATGVMDRLRLLEYARHPARTLSMGNLQRLALARALIHRPELLVLDEPANGLDPAGIVELREMLRRLAREEGVTVFMSSHILTEVDRLATRVGILHHGRLIEELSAADLDARRKRRLQVGAEDVERAEGVLRAAGFRWTRARHGDRWVLDLPDERALDRPHDIARMLVEAGTPPWRVAIVQEDMEQHFLRLTGREPLAEP